jgi:hypothetical protein
MEVLNFLPHKMMTMLYVPHQLLYDTLPLQTDQLNQLCCTSHDGKKGRS